MATQYRIAGPDVTALADRVIDDWPSAFAPIREYAPRIEYLLAYGDGDSPAVKHHGAAAIAVIKKVKDEEKAAGGPDLRIVIDARKFGGYGERTRMAVLAHELYHVVFVVKDGRLKRDAYGRPRVKLRPDDWSMTGFVKVAERFGEASIERRSFKALSEILSQGQLPFVYADDLAADVAEEPGPPLARVMTVSASPEAEAGAPDFGAELRGTIVGREIARSLPPETDEDEDEDDQAADLDATLAAACEKAEARKGIDEAFPSGVPDFLGSTDVVTHCLDIEAMLHTPDPNIAEEQTGAGLGPFPKLAAGMAEAAAGKDAKPKRERKPKSKYTITSQEGVTTSETSLVAADEPDDDSDVFVIRNKRSKTLAGFCEAPTLVAAIKYAHGSFGVGFTAGPDLDGLVTRSPGYSVPSVDAEGKLVGGIKAKAERPAAKTKTKGKGPQKAQGVRP